jgi:hypothetical protein
VLDGHILGVRYGFRGFYDKDVRPIVLTKESVDGIQLQGGTILGTSRGGADIRSVIHAHAGWHVHSAYSYHTSCVPTAADCPDACVSTDADCRDPGTLASRLHKPACQAHHAMCGLAHVHAAMQHVLVQRAWRA